MIPKVLYLAFVALQDRFYLPSVSTPSDVCMHSTTGSPYHSTSSEAHISTVQQPGTAVSNDRVDVPFNYFPPGDISEDGQFGDWILSGGRIYDLRYAFPDIPLPFEYTHGWGAYPNGKSLNLTFLEKDVDRVTVRFGWILNQRLAPFEFTYSLYSTEDNRFHNTTGRSTAAEWEWSGGLSDVSGVKSLEILSRSGEATGTLFVLAVTYGTK